MTFSPNFALRVNPFIYFTFNLMIIHSFSYFINTLIVSSGGSYVKILRVIFPLNSLKVTTTKFIPIEYVNIIPLKQTVL